MCVCVCVQEHLYTRAPQLFDVPRLLAIAEAIRTGVLDKKANLQRHMDLHQSVPTHTHTKATLPFAPSTRVCVCVCVWWGGLGGGLGAGGVVGAVQGPGWRP